MLNGGAPNRPGGLLFTNNWSTDSQFGAHLRRASEHMECGLTQMRALCEFWAATVCVNLVYHSLPNSGRVKTGVDRQMRYTRNFFDRLTIITERRQGIFMRNHNRISINYSFAATELCCRCEPIANPLEYCQAIHWRRICTLGSLAIAILLWSLIARDSGRSWLEQGALAGWWFVGWLRKLLFTHSITLVLGMMAENNGESLQKRIDCVTSCIFFNLP